MFNRFIFIIILALFSGCSTMSIPSVIGGEPSSVESKISSSIDKENEVYGIGSAKIESSGTLIAMGKAKKEARDELKDKILSEEKIIFNSFLINADPYTKGILEPALSDLKDYTATELIQKSIEKDSWVEKNEAYTIISISKGEILSESQHIFIQYLDDITNKFQTIKEGVSQPQ